MQFLILLFLYLLNIVVYLGILDGHPIAAVTQNHQIADTRIYREV